MSTVPLFSPFILGSLTLRNRIGVSPMCQYSSVDGLANEWHHAHIGARASGGAGLIIMEATGVNPEGRITPHCHGLWGAQHAEALKPITAFAREQGAAIGVQLAHAGRKASMQRPWDGGGRISSKDGGWITWAPSAIPFAADHEPPKAMTLDDIKKLKDDFIASARLAVKAGFQLIELHGAHGYLLHQFMSPLSNKREDEYGGSEENRFRLIREIARELRADLPRDIVLGARLSCVDWTADGLQIEDTLRLSAQLKEDGLEFIDCSSGFVTGDARIPFAPGFQVPFASKIRHGANIPTAAVGMITEPQQANEIIEKGDADIVLLARAMLKDPYWPIHAALSLGVEADIPAQYLRGFNADKFAKKKAS